jgi:outer membrane cobalamin receptor
MTLTRFKIRLFQLLPMATIIIASSFPAIAQKEGLPVSNRTDNNLPGTLQQASSHSVEITRDEIVAYGCREIADVLKLLPGVEFAGDVMGAVGISVRGIWAYEGKILVQLNGIPINDMSGGYFNFLGSLPAAMIEKVEVYRGGTGVIHGTHAQLMTVNIITTSEQEESISRINGQAGMVGNSPTYGINLQSQVVASEDTRIAFGVGLNRQPLAHDTYTDSQGNIASLDIHSAQRKWYHFNADLQHKKFRVRFHRTHFRFNGLAGKDGVAANPVRKGIYPNEQENYNMGLNVSFELKAGNHWVIAPSFLYTRGNAMNTPVYQTSELAPWYGTGNTLKRFNAAIKAKRKAGEHGFFKAGAGQIRDLAEAATNNGQPALLLENAADSVVKAVANSSFLNVLYAYQRQQWAWEAGGRFEYNSFGNTLSPYVAVTYNPGHWCFNAVYSSGFRTPMPFLNYSRAYNFQGSLTPEKSQNMNLIIEYAPDSVSHFTLNPYYVRVTNLFSARNHREKGISETSALGLEAAYRMKFKHGEAFVNFGWSQPGSRVSDAFLSGNNRFLGSSSVQASLGYHYSFNVLELGTTLNYLSGRSARQTRADLSTRQAYRPLLLWNLNVGTRQFFVEGFSAYIVLNNITSARYQLLQPYRSGYPVIPAKQQQIGVQLAYRIK